LKANVQQPAIRVCRHARLIDGDDPHHSEYPTVPSDAPNIALSSQDSHLSLRIAIEIDRVLVDVSDRVKDEPAVDWARLDEREPRIVSRLAELAAARQWEILFLTSVHANRDTAQSDAQRWLESKGFAFPSVYVAPGSRGRIAAALDLDVVIGGSPRNCAEVADLSQARAILIRRPEQSVLPEDGSRRFDVAASVGGCLDELAAEDGLSPETRWFAWARRLLGLKESKA
jgi:hypothetical protein